MNEHILVVDDDDRVRDVIVEFLRREGMVVDSFKNPLEALRSVQKTAYDIILTDVRMPEMDGHGLLKRIMELYPDCIVIMMTGYGTIENAVEAMKAGAYDYILKPIRLVELRALLRNAVEKKNLRLENLQLSSQLKKKYRFDNIVGTDEKMIAVFKLVEKVASTTSTVLVTGESGTGKELIARAIHYNSPRKDKAMISVNCGALSETLLEDELFGHVRGAFTSALSARPGRFELANFGTLFLDEIGNMSQNLQIKLLRVLQEKKFERLGGTNTIQVDVRIIAATSSDLKKMVEDGDFRKDLFYRLNVINIELPPLRKRKGDIPLLLHHIIENLCRKNGQPPKAIAQDVMKYLQNYHWPGNVRQLENVLERAVILLGERAEILPDDLPPEILDAVPDQLFAEIEVPDEGLSLNAVVANLERELIAKTLQRTGGNKKQAAELLRLKRTTLLEKLRRLNMQSGLDR
jgi:DNA-binding NtrC family response regulator